ncbi:hypothetical protein IFT96_23080 [Pseudomonas fluorescens]|uniref:hypothetical protein n=1 Tax=Pseudomonas paracarnis TaxID=2750625 RepID=UPI0017852DE6|nr:hypothetical protein [Pseudomonas paracarnis]MBD8258258.1 hypothetical protein [Pseudomonas fluorescens]MDV3058618.1 hypothetical protein [Pseudomonas paracarnis]
MDTFEIPQTIFVALGVTTAALVAGFFSFLAMVSAKENKISEFRLNWADGLRAEISEFTAAAQELARANAPGLFNEHNFSDYETSHKLDIEWFKETKQGYARALESLTKIQLRLNPKDIHENPESAEAKLMSAIKKARDLTGEGTFEDIMDACNEIRLSAAPILKDTWSRVKNGEDDYQKIRKQARRTIFIGFYLVGAAFSVILLLLIANYTIHQAESLQAQSATEQNYKIIDKPVDSNAPN